MTYTVEYTNEIGGHFSRSFDTLVGAEAFFDFYTPDADEVTTDWAELEPGTQFKRASGFDETAHNWNVYMTRPAVATLTCGHTAPSSLFRLTPAQAFYGHTVGDNIYDLLVTCPTCRRLESLSRPTR